MTNNNEINDALATPVSHLPGPVLDLFLPRVGGEITAEQIKSAFAEKGFGHVHRVRLRPWRNGSGWHTAEVRLQMTRTPRAAALASRLASGQQWRLHYSADVSWWNWPITVPRSTRGRDYQGEWNQCAQQARRMWGTARPAERTDAEMERFVHGMAEAVLAQ